jgi:AbrB family looped-hinge helix DNA binding protein
MARYCHEIRMAKTQSTYYETVRVGAKCRIMLPSRIVEALRLKNGDYMLMRLVDRKLELVPIPRDQLWFWTPEWQKKEREADEDSARGRVKESASVEALLKDLKS